MRPHHDLRNGHQQRQFTGARFRRPGREVSRVHGPHACRVENHFTRLHPLYALPPLPLDISSFPSQQRCLALSTTRTSKIAGMSSPSQRRTRGSQSGTPRRSARQSENNTPQNAENPAGASSPLFFESSPAPGNQDSGPSISSPLRQMSNSQSTQSQNAGLAPSSPLRQMTESQEQEDGNKTPRASGQARGMFSSD